MLAAEEGGGSVIMAWIEIPCFKNRAGEREEGAESHGGVCWQLHVLKKSHTPWRSSLPVSAVESSF